MGWCRPRIHLPQAMATADLDSARIVMAMRWRTSNGSTICGYCCAD
jgi:hypothetical protein